MSLYCWYSLFVLSPLLNGRISFIRIFSAITSWKIEGKKIETVTVFLFLGSKITVDGDCSYEIRKCLLLGKKAMTNLDSVLKSRDITMLTKVRIVRLWSSQWSCMIVRAGLSRRQNTKELIPSSCGAGEDAWESLGQQDQTNLKGNEPWIRWKDWC